MSLDEIIITVFIVGLGFGKILGFLSGRHIF